MDAILHALILWRNMALWKFFHYITEDDRDLIQEWYTVQDPEVQAQFDATLLILAATNDWEASDIEEFKPLTKKHSGLGEIRFHIIVLAPGARRPHRRRFRPVGIWPTTKHREFVLILGCEKRGKQFIPHAAFDVALEYKALLDQERGTIREQT